MEKVQLILDTDMDTDCDDAGALAVLNNYLIKGRVDVKAVICDAPSEYGGSCISHQPVLRQQCAYWVVKPEDWSGLCCSLSELPGPSGENISQKL